MNYHDVLSLALIVVVALFVLVWRRMDRIERRLSDLERE
jgi:Tfp pilus assembly protein PilX